MKIVCLSFSHHRISSSPPRLRWIGSSSTTYSERNLVDDIEAMLNSSKQQFSTRVGGLGIISVPPHLRKLEEQAFTPQLISIGPIHLYNEKLQSTQRYKEQLCASFLQWTDKKVEDIVRIIKCQENRIRSYYAKTILSGIEGPDFVRMILVDAMFIFGYFCSQVLQVSDNELPSEIPNWMHPFFKLDMVLLENQLPFFVLETLFREATSGEVEEKFCEMFSKKFPTEPLSPASNRRAPLESNQEFLQKSDNNFFKRLAIEFFQSYNFQRMLPEKFLMEIENFTDLVRLFYLNSSKMEYSATQLHKAGVKLPDRTSGRAKLSYSATKLHEAGVKFKGVKFDEANQPCRCFLDLRFDLKSGVLEIPCITLNAEKLCLIRNISALEQSLYVGNAYVTDFFVILDFLIDTSKDVDLLCDKGILVNYLGDSNAAALAINSLNTDILWDFIDSNYSRICEELNVFYKKPWHRWRATLWRQYFSTPWRATSTSAAIILLLLTLAQTVCSLKSTIW